MLRVPWGLSAGKFATAEEAEYPVPLCEALLDQLPRQPAASVPAPATA